MFLQLLRKNQNLRSLALHNYGFIPVPDSVAPVALSNLRRLVFTDGCQYFCFSAEDGALGASTSASDLSLEGGVDPNKLLSVVSSLFGSGWEEATQVYLGTPDRGWEREIVDQFLSRLTKMTVLSVRCWYNCTESLFASLEASQDRCPNLSRICIDTLTGDFPNALRSIRRLVKQRAEDGIPLEAVEQIYPSLSTAGIWDSLYDQLGIKDYLKTRGSR